jgi:hypothetical protein
MATHRVGGEVDASCTRCRMELAHTILAMVGTKVARVRCNTCGSDHVYRGTQRPSRSAAAQTRAAAEKTPKTVVAFDASSPPWMSRRRRTTGQTTATRSTRCSVTPPSAWAIVRSVRQDKMDVAFKAAERTLVQGRSAGTARPSFSPPHRPEDAPDAPRKADRRERLLASGAAATCVPLRSSRSSPPSPPRRPRRWWRRSHPGWCSVRARGRRSPSATRAGAPRRGLDGHARPAAAGGDFTRFMWTPPAEARAPTLVLFAFWAGESRRSPTSRCSPCLARGVPSSRSRRSRRRR